MNEFEYKNGNDAAGHPGNDDDRNRANNEKEIEVTAIEKELEDSSYHYAGDPYGQENAGENGQKEQKNGRYRYQGQSVGQDQYGDGFDSENGYGSEETSGRGRVWQNPEDRRRKNRALGGKAAKFAGAALLFGLVAGVGFTGVTVVKDRFFPSRSVKIETTTVDNSKNNSKNNGGAVSADTDISKIVEGVMPSVVSITSKMQTTGFYGFGVQESEGAGSGFILAKTDDNLMIATNNHVISGANSLTVGFADGSTAAATIVGADADADLAVISVKIKDISDETLSKIKIAVLGDSDDLQVGESVIAIGNALGYGQSVTTGVISAKNREVSFTDGTMTLLQTDAAINPGNSGGVLVDLEGHVVGINNAKLEDTSVEGMGYAIPIATAQTVLTDIMNAKTIPAGENAYLGIIGKTMDTQYSSALGIPSGIYVTQVVKGSPAEKAGIAAGDVITGFDGNSVSTMEGLKSKISVKEAGTKVKITLKRANQNGEYEEQTVKVTLGKEKDYEKQTKQQQDSTENTQQQSTQQGEYGTDPYDGYNYGNGSQGNGGYYDPFEYFFN